MRFNLITNVKFLSFFLIGVLIIYTAFASSTGAQNELTSATSHGCNCHDPVSNSETTVSVVSSTGSFNVAPGSSTDFTITVTNATEKKAGIDIAVKTTQTGETDIGTLTPNVSTGLKPNGKELVHYQPKLLVNGSASFQFTWKAPNTPGTYYLRAVGNAVNGDGDTTGYLDHWNWMPVQPLKVGTTSVTDFENNAITGFYAFPNPASNNINIEYSLSNPTTVDIFVYNTQGVLIKSLG
ncbi:MAG: choice-of-anchor V domain-containing protein, partial [FCB group bacterium]